MRRGGTFYTPWGDEEDKARFKAEVDAIRASHAERQAAHKHKEAVNDRAKMKVSRLNHRQVA